jgi:hypothetical protein
MPVGLLESPMAGEKSKTVSIKLATDVVESARVVAALRGVSMTDMLSDLIRPTLKGWEEDEIRKRAAGITRKTQKRGVKAAGESGDD